MMFMYARWTPMKMGIKGERNDDVNVRITGEVTYCHGESVEMLLIRYTTVQPVYDANTLRCNGPKYMKCV